jgi:glucose-6-phosphate 1-epimerase
VKTRPIRCASTFAPNLVDDRRFGISDLARVCEGNGGLTRVDITSPLARGEMYVHGAHVTSWRPAGSEEVLFLSTKSRWQEGQAIRGGIPICFPWFRGKADDPHAPAHGFVRTRSWQLYSIVENDAGVAVTMLRAMSKLGAGGRGNFVLCTGLRLVPN